MGDTRRRVYEVLRSGGIQTTGQIAQAVNKNDTAVINQLNALERDGLVRKVTRGRWESTTQDPRELSELRELGQDNSITKPNAEVHDEFTPRELQRENELHVQAEVHEVHEVHELHEVHEVHGDIDQTITVDTDDMVEPDEPADDPFAWFDRYCDTRFYGVRIVQCWMLFSDGHGEERFFAVAHWGTPQAAIACETSTFGYEYEDQARSAALNANTPLGPVIVLT